MIKKPSILEIPQGAEPQTTLCRHCAFMVAQNDYCWKEALKQFTEWLRLREYTLGVYINPKDYQALQSQLEE